MGSHGKTPVAEVVEVVETGRAHLPLPACFDHLDRGADGALLRADGEGRAMSALDALRRRDWDRVREILEPMGVSVQSDMIGGVPLDREERRGLLGLLLAEETEPGELAILLGVDASVVSRDQKELCAQIGEDMVGNVAVVVGHYVHRMQTISDRCAQMVANGGGTKAALVSAMAADRCMATLIKIGVITKERVREQMVDRVGGDFQEGEMSDGQMVEVANQLLREASRKMGVSVGSLVED